MTSSNIKTETIKTQNSRTQQDLWSNRYPWYVFLWEIFYLFLTLYLGSNLINKTVKDHKGPLPTLIGFVAGLFFVDFISGLIHWAVDTWGRYDTPIIGPTIIYSFRKHHVEPQDIVVYGSAMLIIRSFIFYSPLPIFVAIGILTSNGSFLSQCFNWMVIFSTSIGVFTNQFHKWSHLQQQKLHPITQFLRRSGIIISFQKHHYHHQGEFNSSYCIINGWMNPILDGINFWRRMEVFITKMTGLKPREDDDYWVKLRKQ